MSERERKRRNSQQRFLNPYKSDDPQNKKGKYHINIGKNIPRNNEEKDRNYESRKRTLGCYLRTCLKIDTNVTFMRKFPERKGEK